MDVTSIILVLVGGLMVYITKPVMKLFGQKVDDRGIVRFKFIGLLIGLMGFLKILDII